MTHIVNSSSATKTEELGEQLGTSLKGGEVIELVSDLGGGKTTLVRGLSRGARASDQVTSPTFTLSNEYKAANFTIYHFDFYRLAEPGIMANELAEAMNDKANVIVIEWGDIVADILPTKRLTIKLTASGETVRTLEFCCPPSLKYLLPK